MHSLISNLSEGAKPSGPGWEKIPGSDASHGGMRKPKKNGKFTYWYPSRENAHAAIDHHEGALSKIKGRNGKMPPEHAHHSEVANGTMAFLGKK